MKHTPTPWAIHHEWGGDEPVAGAFRICPQDHEAGHIVAIVDDLWLHSTTSRAQANAEFIVRACNAHNNLVAACQAFLDKWRRQGMDANLQLEKFDQVARDMEAAIRKATGE